MSRPCSFVETNTFLVVAWVVALTIAYYRIKGVIQ